MEQDYVVDAYMIMSSKWYESHVMHGCISHNIVPLEFDILLALVLHLSQNQKGSHILPLHPPKGLHKAALCHNSTTFHDHPSCHLASFLHTSFHLLKHEEKRQIITIISIKASKL